MFVEAHWLPLSSSSTKAVSSSSNTPVLHAHATRPLGKMLAALKGIKRSFQDTRCVQCARSCQHHTKVRGQKLQMQMCLIRQLTKAMQGRRVTARLDALKVIGIPIEPAVSTRILRDYASIIAGGPHGERHLQTHALWQGPGTACQDSAARTMQAHTVSDGVGCRPGHQGAEQARIRGAAAPRSHSR